MLPAIIMSLEEVEAHQALHRVVKALVSLSIFSFHEDMLKDKVMRPQLVMRADKRPMISSEVSSQIRKLRQLLAGKNPACPNFLFLLQDSLREEKLKFESAARTPEEQQLQSYTNCEPDELEWDRRTPFVRPQGDANIDASPKFNFTNSHSESEVKLPSLGRAAKSKVAHWDGQEMRSIYNEGKLKQEGSRKTITIGGFCLLAVLASILFRMAHKGLQGYKAFLKAIARSSSPDPFLAFLAHIQNSPTPFVTEAMMQCLLQVVHEFDKGEKTPGSKYRIHPMGAIDVAELLHINSGVEVNFCGTCEDWWKAPLNFIEHESLLTSNRRVLSHLPVHYNGLCEKCGENEVSSSNRVNSAGFFSIVKEPLKYFKLGKIMLNQKFRRTIKIGDLIFICRGAVFVCQEKKAEASHAYAVMLPDAAGSSIYDGEIWDPNSPAAKMTKEEAQKLPAGFVDAYVYVRG